MKTNQATAGGRFGIVFLAILGLAAATAWAGIQAPLYVGNVAPVRDQYGRVLVGSALPEGAAGRSLVEVRTTASGVILPRKGLAEFKRLYTYDAGFRASWDSMTKGETSDES